MKSFAPLRITIKKNVRMTVEKGIRIIRRKNSGMTRGKNIRMTLKKYIRMTIMKNDIRVAINEMILKMTGYWGSFRMTVVGNKNRQDCFGDER